MLSHDGHPNVKSLPTKEQLQMMETFLVDPYAYYLTGTDVKIVQYMYMIFGISTWA
jgi:hypothetical protein